MGLEGLRLIQKRVPSAEEAAELAVQQQIRKVEDWGDGTIQYTTVIPRAMPASSWPANPKEWQFDEIPHPSDWSSVQVCSDKRCSRTTWGAWCSKKAWEKRRWRRT